MTEPKSLYILAVDGSANAERAVDYAAKLAAVTSARLMLLHVVAWSEYSFINALEIDEQKGLRDRERTHAEKDIIEPLVKRLSGSGVDVTTRIEFGHPARTIAALAENLNAEMTIAGTHGRSDVASLVLGSFSHGLIQLSKKPLLFVP